MRKLVFYDSTGKVWLIAGGETELAPGCLCMWVDFEGDVELVRIDVTDPDNPQPVFSAQPDSQIGILQKQMVAVNKQMAVNALAASFVAESFTDEQALKVPSLYPEWSGDAVAYKTGDRVLYDGVLYKVLQDHTSAGDWTPDYATSVFAKVLIPDETVIPEWEQPDSTNGYSIGDRVTHNGKTWESQVDNNVWEPGADGVGDTIWAEVA